MPKLSRDIVTYSSFGIEIGVAAAVGVWLGKLADAHFGIAPLGLILGVTIGVGSSLTHVFMILLKNSTKNRDDNK